MSEENNVLDVIVCFVLALGLLVWLTRMNAFHYAQLPVKEESFKLVGRLSMKRDHFSNEAVQSTF